MRALLAIVGRELWLRGSVLPAALLLGCVPVALDISTPGFIASTALAGMSVGLLAIAILVGVTALFSGWSMITPEQSAGRLGFLFSRPASWSSIWGGKLAAAVALPVGAAALAVLPSLVADPSRWPAFWSTPQAGVQLFDAGTLMLLLVGLGNAGSVAWRSRPMQRAIDLVLIAGFLIVLLKPSLLLTVAAWSFGYAHQAAVGRVPVALAALVASAVQIAVGRTDPRRSHAAFSLTLWPALYAAMLPIAGVGHLMATSPPSLLRRVERAEGAPRGGWIFVSGPVRWGQYVAAFLYEPASGKYVSLGSAHHVSRLSFSRDGNLAAVVERDPLEAQRGRTRVVRLWAPVPVAETVFTDLAADVAVSHDYLASLRSEGGYSTELRGRPAPGWWHAESGSLDFYRLPSGDRVRTASRSERPGPGQQWRWRSPLGFLDDGQLRIAWSDWGWPRVALYVLDPDRRVLLQGGIRRGRRLEKLDVEPYAAVPLAPYEYWSEALELRSNETGDRLLLQRSRLSGSMDPLGWRICLHESASGDHLRTLFAGPGIGDADFLSYGLRGQAGIAVAAVRNGHGTLRLLTSDGAELTPGSNEDLGPALSVSVAGEPGPGYLCLGVRRNKEDFGYTFVVGPAGTWSEAGIYPVAPRAEAEDSHGAGRPAAGSLGSRLFISEDGTLVRYDPETRARTVLLGRAGG